MTTYYFYYHLLIGIAFVLSITAFARGHKKFIILGVLLCFTLAVELAADILYKKKIDFTWIYHLFNLVEYSLFCWFLSYSVWSKRVKQVVFMSIPVFLIIGFCISFWLYSFSGFPGININIEGFLLSVLCIYILFTLEADTNLPIYANSDFWICLGILLFFGCTFFFNGIYTGLFNISKQHALEIFAIINKPMNIILYLFIIIGITCSLLKKRRIIRSF